MRTTQRKITIYGPVRDRELILSESKLRRMSKRELFGFAIELHIPTRNDSTKEYFVESIWDVVLHRAASKI